MSLAPRIKVVNMVSLRQLDVYECDAYVMFLKLDNHGSGSPPNSVCSGYPYYVSLIEPNTATFCIRCCETYSDCNAGRSAYGCDRVVPAL